jgi:hypothetical protein
MRNGGINFAEHIYFTGHCNFAGHFNIMEHCNITQSTLPTSKHWLHY